MFTSCPFLNLLAVDNNSLQDISNQALKDITMDIPEKQVTAFIGPSGCGKSTLGFSILRVLKKNQVIKEGQIILNLKNTLVDLTKLP